MLNYKCAHVWAPTFGAPQLGKYLSEKALALDMLTLSTHATHIYRSSQINEQIATKPMACYANTNNWDMFTKETMACKF